MFRNFFRTSESYKEQVAEYGQKDAIIAIAVWIIVMVVYYLMGQLHANKDVYIGIYVNIFLAILCISLVLLRKEKITTIGFTKNIAVIKRR